MAECNHITQNQVILRLNPKLVICNGYLTAGQNFLALDTFADSLRVMAGGPRGALAKLFLGEVGYIAAAERLIENYDPQDPTAVALIDASFTEDLYGAVLLRNNNILRSPDLISSLDDNYDLMIREYAREARARQEENDIFISDFEFQAFVNNFLIAPSEEFEIDFKAEFSDTGDGKELIYAINGVDDVFAGAGDDIIVAGEEAKTVKGGGGDDIFALSENSTEVIGGIGRDTIFLAENDSSVHSLNNYNSVEVLIGGSSGEAFTHSGQLSYLAGGAGADTFVSDGTGTMVVFGGEGADQIQFEHGANILTISVDGLTEGNFHALDLSDPEIYNGVDFTAFDVVVINPDEDDELFYRDLETGEPVQLNDMGMSDGSATFELEEWATQGSFEDFNQTDVLVASNEITFGVEALPLADFAEITIEGLPGSVEGFAPMSVGATGAISGRYTYHDEARPFSEILIHTDESGYEYFLSDADLTISYQFINEEHADRHVVEWRTSEGGPGDWTGYTTVGYLLFPDGAIATSNPMPETIRPWAVVGGHLEGNTLIASSDGQTAMLPEDAFDVFEELAQIAEDFSTTITIPGPPPQIDGTEENDEIDRKTSLVDEEINALAGDDRIYDGEGNDTIYAGEGSDRMYGGMGGDHYDGGGANNDRLYYDQSSEGLIIDMTEPSNSTGIAAGDTFVNVERLHATNFDDTIVMGSDFSQVFALGGDDIITDNEGKDFLWGGTGANTFRFVAGDGQRDEIRDFKVGIDTIDLSEWGVTSYGQLQFTEFSNGHLEIAFGDESILLRGLSAADRQNFTANDFTLAEVTNTVTTVTGTAGNDIFDSQFIGVNGNGIENTNQELIGGAGNDSFYTGMGTNTVLGGEGTDRLYAGDGVDHFDGGGAGNDRVDYNAASGNLTIDMTDASNSTGIAAGDTFANVERIGGSGYDDVIIAGGAVNHVFAFDGDDTIVDNEGRDYLWGGAGADTFRFVSGDNQRDEIRDFEVGIDTIDLSEWSATAFGDLTLTQSSNGNIEIADSADSILLKGLDAQEFAALSESDFIFT